jgi:hypothetical protein
MAIKWEKFDVCNKGGGDSDNYDDYINYDYDCNICD